MNFSIENVILIGSIIFTLLFAIIKNKIFMFIPSTILLIAFLITKDVLIFNSAKISCFIVFVIFIVDLIITYFSDKKKNEEIEKMKIKDL